MCTKACLFHGRYLMSKLGGREARRGSSNHYLADLIGLLHLGPASSGIQKMRARWEALRARGIGTGK